MVASIWPGGCITSREGMSWEPLKYNSVSPVLRYNTGLFYGQLLPQEKGRKVMARVSAKLRRFGILQLLQFLQDLITAATGNPNAPTPNPHLVTLQGLYDDGVNKNNAYTAAQNAASAALAERDEHVEDMIAAINAYIGSMESHTAFDAVKLQSLGLPLRSTPVPPQPCVAPVLVATVGEDAEEMRVKWPAQVQADSWIVQTSPDPMLPTSWVQADVVSDPKIRLIRLTSGQKRWVRVRGVNRLGYGPWSNPVSRMIP
jgi:hypothetical protein